MPCRSGPPCGEVVDHGRQIVFGLSADLPVQGVEGHWWYLCVQQYLKHLAEAFFFCNKAERWVSCKSKRHASQVWEPLTYKVFVQPVLRDGRIVEQNTSTVFRVDGVHAVQRGIELRGEIGKTLIKWDGLRKDRILWRNQQHLRRVQILCQQQRAVAAHRTAMYINCGKTRTELPQRIAHRVSVRGQKPTVGQAVYLKKGARTQPRRVMRRWEVAATNAAMIQPHYKMIRVRIEAQTTQRIGGENLDRVFSWGCVLAQ